MMMISALLMKAAWRCTILFILMNISAISPDIQVVHNLTGASKANTVTIFGLRLHCKL